MLLGNGVASAVLGCGGVWERLEPPGAMYACHSCCWLAGVCGTGCRRCSGSCWPLTPSCSASPGVAEGTPRDVWPPVLLARHALGGRVPCTCTGGTTIVEGWFVWWVVCLLALSRHLPSPAAHLNRTSSPPSLLSFIRPSHVQPTLLTVPRPSVPPSLLSLVRPSVPPSLVPRLSVRPLA